MLDTGVLVTERAAMPIGPEAASAPIARHQGRSVRELSLLIARGDRGALGEFYEQWFERLLSLARSLTGRDEAFCLDVVQEVMLRVARRMRAMESDDDVARWMVRVVHTTAIDLLRREARLNARQRHASGPAEGPASDEEQIRWLRAQVAALPAEDRSLLWLRFGGERTAESMGAAAGTSGDAVSGRLRRVLAKLRKGATEDER